MKSSNYCRGFSRKRIFFVCLLSLFLFASNAFADLCSYNLMYASPELNGGKVYNYGTVTVNLTSQDHATITFKSTGTYSLENRLGVQVNAFVFGVTNLTEGSFVAQKNFSGFGDFNASFSGLSDLTSYSFNLTRKSYIYDKGHWTSAAQVLRINDWGYQAISQIDPETGNSGYAAASTYFMGRGVQSMSAVPLPGAVLLLGSGLVGLAAIRRRRAA